MLDAYRQDAKYAARALARSPLFTLVAVLSVAIGVGATTAIMTLANALLLRQNPGIGAPERLVQIGRTQDGKGFDNFSYPNYVDYQAGSKALSAIAAMDMEPLSVSLAGPSGGEPFRAGVVSGNFFEVLRARPALGRFFLAEEDAAPGASRVVVVSHRFWRDRLSSAASIVGRTITLNSSPFTVVGVAAEGFHGALVVAPDMWVPINASTLLGVGQETLTSRAGVWLIGIGRLAENATRESAAAELAGIAKRLEAEYPEANRGKGIKLTPSSGLPGELRLVVGGFMGVLFAIAGLVLLVASINVAGMLLARATTRQREIAVRLALGASRGQLMRQLVVESLMLFALAGGAGLIVANWLVGGLVALIPKLPIPVALDSSVDWRLLTFALAAALLIGFVTGVVPALQSSRPDLVPALKSNAGGGRHRLRSGLLIAQIAFSMLLLIVAGLFGRALVRARSIDPGFDPAGLHIASMDLSLANYNTERGTQALNTIVERTLRLPQVQAAAIAAMLPLGGGGMGLGGVEVSGVAPADAREGWREDWNVVTPGYFRTMRIPMFQGREFTDADRLGSAAVAILNETFAKTLFPGQNPIGRTLRNDSATITVVGIARNSKYRTLGEEPRNFIYVPMAQRYISRAHLLVRVSGPTSPAAAVRKMIADLDPALPILDQMSFETHAATSLFPQRIALYVAGSLGGVALLLALLGIYGVAAYGVAQRTREIGVRVALGADRGRVVGLVLRHGFRLAGIGVAIGSLAGLGATRLLSALLYGVPARDPIAFVGAAAMLGVAALAASWIPAMRAAAVDPVVALRSE